MPVTFVSVARSDSYFLWSPRKVWVTHFGSRTWAGILRWLSNNSRELKEIHWVAVCRATNLQDPSFAISEAYWVCCPGCNRSSCTRLLSRTANSFLYLTRNEVQQIRVTSIRWWWALDLAESRTMNSAYARAPGRNQSVCFSTVYATTIVANGYVIYFYRGLITRRWSPSDYAPKAETEFGTWQE